MLSESAYRSSGARKRNLYRRRYSVKALACRTQLARVTREPPTGWCSSADLRIRVIGELGRLPRQHGSRRRPSGVRARAAFGRDRSLRLRRFPPIPLARATMEAFGRLTRLPAMALPPRLHRFRARPSPRGPGGQRFSRRER